MTHASFITIPSVSVPIKGKYRLMLSNSNITMLSTLVVACVMRRMYLVAGLLMYTCRALHAHRQGSVALESVENGHPARTTKARPAAQLLYLQ
jgi:hypothetical protein